MMHDVQLYHVDVSNLLYSTLYSGMKADDYEKRLEVVQELEVKLQTTLPELGEQGPHFKCTQLLPGLNISITPCTK